MKILNLYAGLGGNRKFWGNEHDITAVEYDKVIAAMYQKSYPNDTVIIGDAHQYLLDHHMEFDFIWSSPPCPSHSRTNLGKNYKRRKNGDLAWIYPDMSLYQEIILLQYQGRAKYAIENVIPYYLPLIPPTKKIGRHLFWSNFPLPNLRVGKTNVACAKISELESTYGINITIPQDEMSDKRALRNCVDPKIGKAILEAINEPTLEEYS